MLICLAAQPLPVKELQIKAVFLFNFTQFVEWPASSFASSKTPLIIGILGENSLLYYLNETVSGESVAGHPLIVKKYKHLDEVSACQILFINRNESEIDLKRLKEHAILTVSDADNFIERGGMIRLYTQNNKIKFQINPEATRAANLNISSKLLRLAEIVNPEQTE